MCSCQFVLRFPPCEALLVICVVGSLRTVFARSERVHHDFIRFSGMRHMVFLQRSKLCRPVIIRNQF